MKQYYPIFIFSFFSALFLLGSCMKEMHDNDNIYSEDTAALTGMNNAYSNMICYNDSMDKDHNDIHAKQRHDQKYHYHDSLFNHYHNIYHHGDTLHHHDMHHTTSNHAQHDSLNQIHHKNHH